MAEDDIRVAELFAGVGGFRLGLEGHPDSDENTGFKVVFSNQYEPGENAQWASKVYKERFGSDGHSNDNIHDFTFPIDGIVDIPDHDLLVGGFPCQDYSVARTISGELGIKGEKGKLWVDIARIIRHKRPRPKVVLLENVPRLLNSPANARGLNFAIILSDLITMGYHVEWRVVNAADYGMPQARKRVFILAYRMPGSSSRKTSINKEGRFGALRKTKGPISRWMLKSTSKKALRFEVGPFAYAFPVTGKLREKFELVPPIDYPFNSNSSPFANAGYAWNHRFRGKSPNKQEFRFWSAEVKAVYDDERQTLDDVLEEEFDKKYEIDPARLDEWRYAKSNKNEFRLQRIHEGNIESDVLDKYEDCMGAPPGKRAELWGKYRQDFLPHVGKNKFYKYDEGLMEFDSRERPSRTVVTAEIGSTPSRMRHIIRENDGRFRRLSPIETERLNMFPDNWTNITDEKGKQIPDSRRGFLMGNALVVGVIKRLRRPLLNLIRNRSE